MDNFRREVLKVNKSRVHKVKNSLGVYDAYKWLRKNKWLDMEPISEHDFYAIIRAVNKALAKSFLHLGSINLPLRMGEIILRKYHPSITLQDGKIKTNLPVDWDSTLQLWSEDKESYKKRTLIRLEEKEVFKVLYDKSKALYNNKSFYTLELNRDIKLSLKKQLKNGLLDAFMLCGKI
ncbi:MAG: hypothetical protein SPI06_07930 [Terrisporobacter sp.]|uniref:hypothetical protein n=1 Tax=Terrisporobacter sp. TaxID=1965305 RepID=UPI002A91FD6D|nr:hypothetical protein [Terrisporobacter sp.]MDY6153325.1 hypothetical protein [Terrisporobacter sp.]